MQILSKHRSANVFCDCPDHVEARKAGVEARKIVVTILQATEVKDWVKVDSLLPELLRLHAIARQCDE